jgi:hypothetical protein
VRPAPIADRGDGRTVRLGHNGAVNNKYRWFNQSLPQTLQIAVMLLYIDAVFLLINFAVFGLGLVLLAGMVAGGFGISNEKKWGYVVALIVSILQVVLLLAVVSLGTIFSDVGLLLTFMFNIGLVALLLHPMSREYQRIWFR